MRSTLVRTARCLLLHPLVGISLAIPSVILQAQVLELRHVFEQYHDWKLQVGGSFIGPTMTRVDPASAQVVPGDSLFHPYYYLSLEYADAQLGLTTRGTTVYSPFIRWNPTMPNSLGGKSSRWSVSLSWEGNFARSPGEDPNAVLQPDNSVYSPTSSVSFLCGYWAGRSSDATAWRIEAFRRAVGVDTQRIEKWGRARRGIDWSWKGHGQVDTVDFATFPLDTNTYIRGMLIPVIMPEMASRQGFSAAAGFGTGKYAGSGPLSSFLNIGGKRTEDLQRQGELFAAGINPIATARYRLGDVIVQLDVAGEDLNLGVILRSLKAIDIEGGLRYLEHAFPRSTRGPNRAEFFLAVRYAPLSNEGRDLFEWGEGVSAGFADDSDGDGIPDEIERSMAGTDPNLPDTDGDGLSDGVEIITYRTNPLALDSDGDGIDDARELTAARRTDPLRSDTDGDGVTDGEELANGTDPLVPSGGERSR